jgi:DNA helicase-2/ATP-dependent DNA helicase PcrA
MDPQASAIVSFEEETPSSSIAALRSASLNPAQAEAVLYGIDGRAPGPPLLVIAGAGSGKTHTLAHRVARLVISGADPRRILLLTFTRRAASEMTRRVERIVANTAKANRTPAGRSAISWAGTFHAIANRILRLHAESVSLDPDFTVLDRSDSADLLELLRHEAGLSKTERRFPQKGTCLAIYSRVVNARERLGEALSRDFPWCAEWEVELKALFRAYTERKQQSHVLDYDDLLLYWHALMHEPALAARIGERFDYVLVDEYQDTNTLQAEIVKALRPDGRGVTVVGDDAQAIYAFRAADVRNILTFPDQYEPRAAVVILEQSYRATQPVLDAANAVIGLAQERFTKNLFSRRASQQKPVLVQAFDEAAQAEYVAEEVLAHREQGVSLKRQAVLFRASHHSDLLEIELVRRNIPFVKYGGLRFLEAAHVKDFLSLLRMAENPRDEMAGFRCVQLLPGAGPAFARNVTRHLAGNPDVASLATLRAPPAARESFAGLVALLSELSGRTAAWPAQLTRVRTFYQPLLERLHDHAAVRALDLDALERLAADCDGRERFLSELALDPPQATGDEAGPPLLDEDYLVLSTIHSAKGQEWDAVFVLQATDGAIPTCRAGGSAPKLEEERRLLYVAMTRARDFLHVIHPVRYYPDNQPKRGDRHLYAPRTRFIPDELLAHFELRTCGPKGSAIETSAVGPRVTDLGQKLRDLWT